MHQRLKCSHQVHCSDRKRIAGAAVANTRAIEFKDWHRPCKAAHEMNVLEQSLKESHENLIVDAPEISRAISKTPRRLLTQSPRRKHSALPALAFVIFLTGLAILVHFLRSETGDLPLPLHEFEGLGIVLCAFAYIGIFIWRLSRALQRDAQEVEAAEKLLEIPSTVAREMNPGK